MTAVDPCEAVWEGIRASHSAGRLAHAYVVVGSPRGDALRFAENLLKLLFCEERDKPCNECRPCRLVEQHKHVDVLWIEPQSKSRQIKADEIRDLVRAMAQTAFEGGWKAGVVLSADCMNPNASNALLKTLEEPPKNSILLLVTDSPQSLLPTILSRCQRIVLSEGRAEALDSLWHEPLLGLLRDLPPEGGLDAARLAGRLKSILDTVKQEIAGEVEESFNAADEAMDEKKIKEILEARTNARLKEVQSEIFHVMVDWHRDLLMLVAGVDPLHLVFADEQGVLADQAPRYTAATALAAIRGIEGMERRLDRNLPDTQVFDEAFRRLTR